MLSMSITWHVWKDPEEYPLCCVCGQSSPLIYKHPRPKIIPRDMRPDDDWLKENKLMLGTAICLLHGKAHRVFCVFPDIWLKTGRATYTVIELQEEFKKWYPTAYWSLRMFNL